MLWEDMWPDKANNLNCFRHQIFVSCLGPLCLLRLIKDHLFISAYTFSLLENCVQAAVLRFIQYWIASLVIITVVPQVRAEIRSYFH